MEDDLKGCLLAIIGNYWSDFLHNLNLFLQNSKNWSDLLQIKKLGLHNQSKVSTKKTEMASNIEDEILRLKPYKGSSSNNI